MQAKKACLATWKPLVDTFASQHEPCPCHVEPLHRFLHHTFDLRSFMATQGAVGEMKTEANAKEDVKPKPNGKEGASPATLPPPSSQCQEKGARPKATQAGQGAPSQEEAGKERWEEEAMNHIRAKEGKKVEQGARRREGQGRRGGAGERQQGEEE